jgi:N-glycosylase/DNA lyase
MEKLIKEIKNLPFDVQSRIDQRLKEFSSFSLKPSEEWFSELCFCILTANAKAKTALAVQADLGAKGFLSLPEKALVNKLLEHKHRFHNTKASRIVEARKYFDVKLKIQSIVKEKDQSAAREWLVKNVKGLGLKEASHFLRNTGHEDVAIIDRHIIALLGENNLIDIPKTVTPKAYAEIEACCSRLSQNLNISLSRLDLCMWYIKTGQVLK